MQEALAFARPMGNIGRSRRLRRTAMRGTRSSDAEMLPGPYFYRQTALSDCVSHSSMASHPALRPMVIPMAGIVIGTAGRGIQATSPAVQFDVQSGAYASSSEVIREAVRDWSAKWMQQRGDIATLKARPCPSSWCNFGCGPGPS